LKSLFTLGTSRRSEEDFVEILLAYGIERVIDVRSFPRGSLPHFHKTALEALLGENLIDYRWLGRELGGFRKGGYEAYTRTAEFMAGVDALVALASEKPSVLLCAERFPWKCHRRWIARELGRRGWRVEHILDKGKTWSPAT
jgi:uncharacterized protein (DUF488 family)